MNYADIITLEPGKRGGKPCIRGMRITVSYVLDYLAGGMSEDTILRGSLSSSATTSAPASPSRPSASGG